MRRLYYFILLSFFPSWNFGGIDVRWAWWWSEFLAEESLSRKKELLEEWQTTLGETSK